MPIASLPSFSLYISLCSTACLSVHRVQTGVHMEVHFSPRTDVLVCFWMKRCTHFRSLNNWTA